MNTVTAILVVAAVAAATVAGTGLVLVILVRARARTVIGRVQKTLREQITKNQKEIIKHRTQIASLTDHVSNIEKRLAQERFSRILPSRPKAASRSVLFLNNGTNHFEQMAIALRRRGWDAVLARNVPPAYNADLHSRRHTLSLFSYDPHEMRAHLHCLHDLIPYRFRLVHFGGEYDRNVSFFREGQDQSDFTTTGAQWNVRELKERGVRIAYTTSGGFDGIRQSAFDAHTGACNKCAWKSRPDLCSDERNSSWGDSIVNMCDFVTIEADYASEWRRHSFVVREPLASVLDPDYWAPTLDIPNRWRLARPNGELIVVHDSGDPASRRFGGGDIRGTSATVEAIERLQSDDGVSVRLVQLSDVPNRYQRYIQAQADVIVDQLVVGRYGARAREGMMLGKPTICHVNPSEPEGVTELTCLQECPLVDATEDTIYPVLKRLLLLSDEREDIGRASRTYALKWHAAESAAVRYEQVYDRIMEGG